jgi:hypothetical protein
MSRLVLKKYAFVGIDIERSSPLPANGRSEVQPRQRLIATQNANSQRSTIANPKYPRKSPSPSLCQSLPRCRQLPSSVSIPHIDVENLCRSWDQEI